MLGLPSALTELVHRLASLPGIGPKSAERLALALLNWELQDVQVLAAAINEAAARVKPCPQCGCLSQDGELCAVCSDESREGTLVCVVETALDAIAVERGGWYQGVYHVLGGALSPVRGVLPEDLAVEELKQRLADDSVSEVIIATNASPDGEATALYLKQELAQSGIRITRLARGLPSGGHLDYADAATLKSAVDNRTEF